MPLLSFTLCLPLIPNLSATYTLLISLHSLENCHILSSILSVTLKVKYCKLLSSYPQKRSSFVYMWLLHLQIQIGHYKQCPKHCWCRPLLVLHGRLVHLVNEPLQFGSYPQGLKGLYSFHLLWFTERDWEMSNFTLTNNICISSISTWFSSIRFHRWTVAQMELRASARVDSVIYRQIRPS